MPENGIRCACANSYASPISKNELQKFKGFMGTEYVIMKSDQVLMLL